MIPSALLDSLPDLSDEAAGVCAKWWADHARNKTPKNNGDGFQSLLGSMVDAGTQVLPEHIDAFEAALKAQILSDEEADYGGGKFGDPPAWRARSSKLQPGHRNNRIGRDYERLSVDYGPNQFLQRAIEKANPDDAKPHGCSFNENKIAGLMPWKTDTNLSQIAFEQSLGYGAPRCPEFQAWDVLPASEFRVVDRWKPPTGARHWHNFIPGEWVKGTTSLGADMAVALITLDPLVVEPTPIALKLRGLIDIESYHEHREDAVIYDFHKMTIYGYLAVICVR